MQVQDVTQKLNAVSDASRASLESGQQMWAQADGWLRQTVRQYPGATLFGCLTLGYAVGRLVARR